MQSPRFYECPAFDATKDYTFNFAWTGNQSMGSKITIRKNTDNSIVYFGNYISMRQEFVLPAKTLTNGTCYSATIEILDSAQNIISDISNIIVFYCYSTPAFTFDNISDDIVIGSSSYHILVNYYQAEKEPLAQYQIGLYDINHALIQSQGIQYVTSPVSQVGAIISTLENSATYFIRATGKTLNNMILDTGFLSITVKYIQPGMFSFIDLQNINMKGNISATSNLISIRGTSNPPEHELNYIDGTMVDLTSPGHYIQFSEGFSFSQNWSMAASFLGGKVNLPLLKWDDGKYTAILLYREGKFESQSNIIKGYFELHVEFPLGLSIITSEYIEPLNDTSKYTLWITKKNNLYEITYNKEA